MAEQSEENVFARANILQWVTDILHGSYESFGDIPAKDVAVLLHAIFNDPNNQTTSSPLVSLHDIQFCEHPTSTTLFLNAKRVLSLIQTLSTHSEMHAVGNMTAAAWLEGKAFVEELKMWRWIRAEAHKRGVEKSTLASRVSSFLHNPMEQNTESTRKRAREETSREVCLAKHESQTQPTEEERQVEEKGKMCGMDQLTCGAAEAATQLVETLQRVKAELQTSQTTNNAAGVEMEAAEETRRSGRPSAACSVCPGVMAAALRHNWDAIERLEKTRRMAISACVRKDVNALLEALATI